MNILIYQTNGKAIDSFQEIETDFYVTEYLDVGFQHSRFEFPGDSLLFKLDTACVSLYDLFQHKILISDDEYYKNIDFLFQEIFKSGLDSDCDISKEYLQNMFEHPLQKIVKNYDFSKYNIYDDINTKKYTYAYLSDCQSMINTLQELLLSCHSYFVNFYKMLCQHPVKLDFEDEYYAITTEGRILFSTASSLFISLYSIFDILTKIAYELENIQDCSLTYKKLASSKILYGDKKKLKNIDFPGTVFDTSRNLSIIVNLRNELIHNATWEMNPKIFFSVKNHVLKEKCIYMPDFTEEGHLVTYKNRKRFFSQGKKLNQELPDIYFDILQRIYQTIIAMK
ncbi:MAG: hypothetical protein ACI4EH_13825 [Oliverpabstia sp.]